MIVALLQTMEDQGNQRVQAHAAAALINFTEDCPKSLLVPYLDNLVKHLHSIMALKLQEVRARLLRNDRSLEKQGFSMGPSLTGRKLDPALPLRAELS